MSPAATKTKPLIVVSSGPRNARTDPESGLRYYMWQGVEYPSVTSARNLAGMPHKLAQWRTNQVIDKAIDEIVELNRLLDMGTDPKAVAAWLRLGANKKRDAAADLGKRVHDAAERGISLTQADADVAPILKQYLSWLASTGANIVLKERQVWNPTVGYAGTFDFICDFAKRPGDFWLVDLKTGSGTYPEHATQLEAYGRSEFIGNDDIVDVAATAILNQVKPSNHAVLHLSPDGWTFKVIPSAEKTWVAFRAILAFALWTDANPTLDNLISAEIGGHA
jgi:hypothetical protein